MEQFTALQYALLTELGDGLCHNGNALGKTLHVSRTAIWKNIKLLITFGFSIHIFPKRGYQLAAPLTLLNSAMLHKHLQNNAFQSPYMLHLFSKIDSTNRYIKSLPSDNLVHICCAETQSQGRGRFGRHWHSPCAENIYCSSRWQFNGDIAQLSGLSLVISLALIALLHDLHITQDLRIKWPNDILWHDKKLSGILIEVLAETNGHAEVVIGIGMNINSDTKNNPLPDKAWCSLYEITGKRFDRNQIIALLLMHLENHIQRFLTSGFKAFIPEWQKYDYLAGKFITIMQSNNRIEGTCLGVNEAGELMLSNESDAMLIISSGDASLKTLR